MEHGCHEMNLQEITKFVGWALSSLPHAAASKRLGTRARTWAGARTGTRAGVGAPRRVTGRGSVAPWGVAARSALAPASTAATRARATVAGAARAVRLHTNVGRLSLYTNMQTQQCSPCIDDNKTHQKAFVPVRVKGPHASALSFRLNTSYTQKHVCTAITIKTLCWLIIITLTSQDIHGLQDQCKCKSTVAFLSRFFGNK